MSKKVTDIVAYLSPIGFFISYFIGTREESRFHLNQALVLLVCELTLAALQKLAGYIPLLGTLINIILGFFSFVVFVIWAIAIISAIREEEKPMPLIGWVKLI